MARIAGVDIPRDKRVEIALTYIYGIGRTRSMKVLTDTNINKDIRVKDLSDDQLVAIRDYIEGTFKVEGDLRRDVAADIRRKVDIGSYQGIRHRKGLPEWSDQWVDQVCGAHVDWVPFLDLCRPSRSP